VGRRLLVLLFALLSVLAMAFVVPLAQAFTTARSQQLYIDRLSDTRRFAVLAEQAMAEHALREDTHASLRAELVTYGELYGGSVTIVDREGQVFLTSSGGSGSGASGSGGSGSGGSGSGTSGSGTSSGASGGGLPLVPGVAEVLANALAGQPDQRVPDVWPWQRQDYVIAEPVDRGSLVLGAVLTVSLTASARADVMDRLLLLTLASAGCVVVAATTLPLPLMRWILRPVYDLDAMAQQLRRGELQARVPVDEGPPELRGLAASFNAMAGSVQSALDQQRAFVADASHQLRNPLTALRLRVEQLAGDPTPAEVGPAAQAALRETDRLARTVDGLLRLARAEASRADRSPVDLAEIAAARLRAWQPVLPQARLELYGRTLALAIPDVVSEILDVLLDNVAKYAPNADVVVSAGGVAPAGFVTLAVRDSGAGVPVDEAARLGERFYRAPSHRQISGTGLGLSIARALATAADGALLITPWPGAFTVTLHLPSVGPSSTTITPVDHL
jgi:signal transduction histidine kinase